MVAIMFAAITALPALALLSTTTPTVTVGDNNQVASNPDHDDGPTIRPVTATIAVNSALPGVQVKIKSVVGLNSKFTVAQVPTGKTFDNLADLEKSYNSPSQVFYEFSSTPITVDANGDAILELDTMIPANLDAVDQQTFLERAFDVLKVTIEDVTNTLTLEVTIDMQRENTLDINKMKAVVNGKRTESLDTDGGDNIKDVSPGDSIELEVELENTLDDQENIDIKNIDLTLSCENSGDFDTDDENIDAGDLPGDEKSTETFNIAVDSDAEDRDSTCDVSVSGKDENGAFHGFPSDFTIEVTRNSHDIVIKKPIVVSPAAISCDTSSLGVTIDVTNMGRSDERRIAIELSSQNLNYAERYSNIELNQDDMTSQLFNVPITGPVATSPLAFTVKTFYDNTRSSNTDTFLVENLCVEEDNEPTPTGTTGGTEGAQATVTLDNDLITASQGASASVSVQVTNEENEPVEYTLSLSNLEGFALASADKTFTFMPGQTTTVNLNFRVNEDVEEGRYTGSVSLLANGRVVATQPFTIDVGQEAAGTGLPSFDFSGSGGTVFWVIVNIILVIIAIFFIRLIFTSGRKKSAAVAPKKMADYEARARKR